MRRKFLLCLGAWALVLLPISGQAATPIVHDAEYYVLKAQHGEKWAAEDKDLDKKLAALKAKHGRSPNIIHIMWDDTGVGELGLEHLQKNRGFATPNINKFATEGQYFTRACTPNLPVRHLAQPS